MPGLLPVSRSFPIEGWPALLGGLYAAALAADLALDDTYGPILVLDPDGASRDVVLPPASAAQAGRVFVLVNNADGAPEDLVVKAESSTVATIGAREIGIVICTGSAWVLAAHVPQHGAPLTTPMIIPLLGGNLDIDGISINNGTVIGGHAAEQGDFVRVASQTLDMGDAAVKLILSGDPQPGEVLLVGQLLIVDPNSSDASEDLVLPTPSIGTNGLILWIHNIGGEDVVVKDAGGSTLVTLTSGDSAQVGFTSGTTVLLASP